MYFALRFKLVALFAAILIAGSAYAQNCGLIVNDPPCQNGPVDITAPAITAGSTNIGTLSYWLNMTATAPLTNPQAITQSGIYYIKNVTGSCTEVKQVKVTIGTMPPTGNSFLYTICSSSTSSSVFFDFQDVGQTSFTLSYTIDGGPPIVVTQTAPTSYFVTGVGPNQPVVMTVAWNGVCHPPKRITGFVPGSNPDFPYNNTQQCVGFVLPTTAPNGITGTWSPSTVTAGTHNYTFTASCYSPQTVTIQGIAPVTPTFNIAPVCQGTTPPANYLPTTSTNGISGTWSPATVNTSTAGTFPYTFTPNPVTFPCAPTVVKNITVTPPQASPTFSFGNNVSLCSGATTGVPVLATTSTNGISGTWSPATVSTTTSGTYTFTPNSGQCSTPFSLNVQITPAQTIQFNGLSSTTPLVLCQGATPPALPTVSNNSTPVTGTWSPSAISTATPGNFTYTFTAAAGQCVAAMTYAVSVTINPSGTPTFAPIPAFCEGTTPVPALPTTSLEGIPGTWSPAQISNSQVGPTTYTFTPSSGQCATTATLVVNVTGKTIPTFTPIAPICAGSTAPVLPTTSNNGITGTWSPSTVDNNASGSYLFTPAAGQCAREATMQIVVNQPAHPGFSDIAVCENETIPPLSTISPAGYSGTWAPAVIDPTQPNATYVFTPDAGQCAAPQLINVAVNPVLTPTATWTVSSYFASGTITIDPGNTGDYLYQLNYGPLQESNVFQDVPPGTHSFTIYDANGCSVPVTYSDVVTIVGYPHFFTPNADGFNDYWNIVGLNAIQPDAQILIFDRYGKLLKQITPAEAGWDGTYNGNAMPSTDYWFLVNYNEKGAAKEYRAHFSLKR